MAYKMIARINLFRAFSVVVLPYDCHLIITISIDSDRPLILAGSFVAWGSFFLLLLINIYTSIGLENMSICELL
jgi:hypothetical protein